MLDHMIRWSPDVVLSDFGFASRVEAEGMNFDLDRVWVGLSLEKGMKLGKLKSKPISTNIGPTM